MSKEKTELQVFQEWVQELKELVFGAPITDLMKKPKRLINIKKVLIYY